MWALRWVFPTIFLQSRRFNSGREGGLLIKHPPVSCVVRQLESNGKFSSQCLYNNLAHGYLRITFYRIARKSFTLVPTQKGLDYKEPER